MTSGETLAAQSSASCSRARDADLEAFDLSSRPVASATGARRRRSSTRPPDGVLAGMPARPRLRKSACGYRDAKRRSLAEPDRPCTPQPSSCCNAARSRGRARALRAAAFLDRPDRTPRTRARAGRPVCQYRCREPRSRARRRGGRMRFALARDACSGSRSRRDCRSSAAKAPGPFARLPPNDRRRAQTFVGRLRARSRSAAARTRHRSRTRSGSP